MVRCDVGRCKRARESAPATARVARPSSYFSRFARKMATYGPCVCIDRRAIVADESNEMTGEYEREPLQLPLGVSLRAENTFLNLLPGPNAEAVATVRKSLDSVAERVNVPDARAGALSGRATPASMPRSVYVWAASECGKTHLLEASCAHAAAAGLTVVYLPLAQHGEYDPTMLHGLDRMHVLCVDDIDAVGGNRDWEEALFHLYNAVEDNNGVLLMAAKGPPSTLSLADLASRLSAGVVLHLSRLNDEQRRQAFVARARQRGFDVPDEVARYVMSRESRGMHALFSLLDDLDHSTLQAKRPLTLALLKRTLRERASRAD